MKKWLVILLSIFSVAAWAGIPEFHLQIKGNLFYPSEMQVPANVKFKLIIENQDDEPEEFDSFDLNREKVIFGHRKATIFVGPLAEGEYQYFGEYHPNTARGKLIATNKIPTTVTGGRNAN